MDDWKNTISANVNQPYKMNSSSVNTSIQPNPNINAPYVMTPNYQNTNLNYAQMYNPQMIQNYYTMMNARNMSYQMQMQNYMAQQYKMNQIRPQANNFNFAQNFQNNLNNYRNFSNNNPNSAYNPPKKQKVEDPEELEKWVQRRRMNFPTSDTVKDKQTLVKKKEEVGMISKLEMKLREKIKLISSINKRSFQKRTPRPRRRRQKFKPKNKSTEIEEGEVIEEEIKQNDGEIENNIVREYKPKYEKINKPNNDRPRIKYNFKYRKNKIYEELIKHDKLKEMNVILQAFRYFVNESLI